MERHSPDESYLLPLGSQSHGQVFTLCSEQCLRQLGGSKITIEIDQIKYYNAEQKIVLKTVRDEIYKKIGLNK